MAERVGIELDKWEDKRNTLGPSMIGGTTAIHERFRRYVDQGCTGSEYHWQSAQAAQESAKLVAGRPRTVEQRFPQRYRDCRSTGFQIDGCGANVWPKLQSARPERIVTELGLHVAE